MPATKMLITVPAMIWSIFHVDGAQGEEHADQRARERPRRSTPTQMLPVAAAV